MTSHYKFTHSETDEILSVEVGDYDGAEDDAVERASMYFGVNANELEEVEQ